jgi:hypothetical protein
MQRRRFNRMLGAAGMSMSARGETPGSSLPAPEVLWLARNGWMPNNERLPVLLYRRALDVSQHDPAARCEELFQRNGWPPQWRNGVYTFHHYEVDPIVWTKFRPFLDGAAG